MFVNTCARVEERGCGLAKGKRSVRLRFHGVRAAREQGRAAFRTLLPKGANGASRWRDGGLKGAQVVLAALAGLKGGNARLSALCEFQHGLEITPVQRLESAKTGFG